MPEIVVVGAGPAGSTLAGRLHAAGRDVLLMDKQDFPRDKTCAGWVTPAVLASLGITADEYGRAHTLQPIHGFRIGLVGQQPVTTPRSGAPLSYGIRRCEFDHYLLRHSAAPVRLGTPVRSLERHGRHWRINGDIEAGLLVGAGGHFCPVARALGAELGRGEAAVAAQEIEFAMSPAQAAACPCDPEIPELYFCPDLQGYGWIFRKGDYLNVGLGRVGAERLGEAVQAFATWLVAEGRLPAGTPERFKGHAYLLYALSERPIIDEACLLIGDAAGLAYTQSGEGIRPAVESALLASRTILAAAGDYDAMHLAPYADAIAERFGHRGGPKRGPVRDRLKLLAAPLLVANRWFASRVIVDRWFLHRQQPALVA